MRISDRGIRFIEREEGCRLAAYRDTGGIWTVGVGDTNHAHEGLVITQEQADAFLREDLRTAETAIANLIAVPLTQAQYDALCSFTFNVGGGNLGGSTLRRLLNAGDYAGAANQFGRWVHDAQGHELQDLADRRARERALFVGE